MKPYKVEIYVYAESADEVRALQGAAHEFVDSYYRQGVLVSAAKLTNLLKNNMGKFMIASFLKK